MKFVFIDPVIGNNYGGLSNYQNLLFDRFLKRGYECRLLSAGDADFPRKLMRELADPETVFYAGMFFFDMRISAHNHFANHSLFDFCDAKVIGRIGDHIFAGFMMERLRNTPRSAQMWADTKSLVDEVHFFHGDSIDVGVTHEFVSVPPGAERPFRPHAERPIDVLVPLSLRQTSFDSFAARLKQRNDSRQVLDFSRFLYESLKNCYGVSAPLPVFAASLVQHGVASWPALDEGTRALLCHILDELDYVVRLEKRTELLDSLADAPSNLRIVVTSTPDNFHRPVPPNVQFIGPQPWSEIFNLFEQSRMVVNSVASFPDSVHERVSNASAFGCATISDSGIKLKDYFKDGESIAFVPQGQKLADICAAISAERSERIGLAALQVVEEKMSVETHIDDVLARL